MGGAHAKQPLLVASPACEWLGKEQKAMVMVGSGYSTDPSQDNPHGGRGNGIGIGDVR
jgi:hypothetical protein